MRNVEKFRKNIKLITLIGLCLFLFVSINYHVLEPNITIINDSEYSFSIATSFFDNVENGTNGWTTSGSPVSNETYGWHIIDWEYYSYNHSWWCGDDTLNKTGNNWNISLVSPLFNLTNAYYVNFSFWHKYEIETFWDYGYVEINVNGTSTWTQIFSFTGVQTTWIKNYTTLSEYAGHYIYIRFRFESDELSTDDGWFIDDIKLEVQSNLYMPTLNNGNVTPLIGNTTTLFTYWVNYTDADNNVPTSINVSIDEIAYPMVKYDPSDSNYTNGCLYNYSTYLANITHTYYFTASDGNFSVRIPIVGNYSGPIVDFINLQPPSLEGDSVTPIEGRYSNTFSFNVTYIDPENQPPQYLNVTINSTSYEMVQENPNDNNYIDGAVFYYMTSMPNDGVYVYHFNTSDGLYPTRFPSNGEKNGPYTWLYDMIGDIPYLNSIHNETNAKNYYKRDVSPEGWICFGLRPLSDIHVDLDLFGNYSLTEFLIGSVATDNRINLLVYDTSNELIKKFYYIRARIQTGDGSYRIESDNHPTLPAIYNVSDENFSAYFNPNEILYIRKYGGHEVGRTYNITVDVPTNMDIDMYIFNQTGGREDAIASSRKIGVGVEESTLFKLTSTSNFTILFTNENGLSGSFNYTITVDSSAPTAVIDFPQSKSYNMHEIDVNLSCTAPDLDSMWYRLRNTTDWITTNITWIEGAQLDLDNGIYTLYAWANDTDNNVQYPPSQVTFTIDTVPPIAIIDSPQAITYSINNIYINLSSMDSDVDSFWYRLYNRTGFNWLDSINLTWIGNISRFFPEGNYSIFAWANDTAGNIQNVTVSINFTVNTPPIINIIVPENFTYTTNVISIELTTSAIDIDTIWYRIANETHWITGNITWSLDSNETLSDGCYALYAWGNDTIGQVSEVVSVNFSIDTTPPSLTIESPQNITYTTSEILINLTSTDSTLDKFWYRLKNVSNGSWIDLTNLTWTIPIQRTLPQGVYTLYVWANDTVGNVQSGNKTFTIDTPPIVIIEYPLNRTYTILTIDINLTSPSLDIHTLWYSIWNGTGWEIINKTWYFGRTETLNEGSYVLYAWGNDTLGLVSLSINVSFTIDVTSPDILIISPENIIYNTSTIIINFSSNAYDLDTIWYRIFNGTTWITENVTWTEPVTLELGNGNYILYIWVNDTHGNENCTIISFTIDIPKHKGPNIWIWISILIVGTVGVAAVLYKYKKSQKKKKKKTGPAKKNAAQILAETHMIKLDKVSL